jgi:predicted transcriptional regulator
LRPGALQLRILEILWEAGEATVAEVHRELAGERELAYTTVATMLRKMEDRRLVRSRREGRRLVYRARVGAQAVRGGLVDDLLDRVFRGSLEDVVHHLLDSREVSSEELDRIADLIARRRGKKR